jgi:hypothetical protein
MSGWRFMLGKGRIWDKFDERSLFILFSEKIRAWNIYPPITISPRYAMK